VVLEGFFHEIAGHLGMLIGETGFLDGRSVHGEGIVVEEFLVEVGGKRGGGDFVFFAEVAPRLEMLVVGGFSDSLHGDGCGDLGLHISEESGLDSEQGLQDGADGSLIGAAFVGKVVGGSWLSVLGEMQERVDDVADVDGVEGEVLVPEEFHLLAQRLVDGGGDHSRGQTREIAGAVDDGGTNDDEVEALDLSELFLGLGLRLGDSGPRLDLGVFLSGLRSRVVNLGGRDFNKDLDSPLRSLGRRCYGDIDVFSLYTAST